MNSLKNTEPKTSRLGFIENFEPWKSSEINIEIPITNHGFVQHSFNRNPGYLLSISALFFADCV